MKLYYYASTIPNFGDELNPWLWPQLAPEIFNHPTERPLFLGIGTLINRYYQLQWQDTYSQVAVLGTGAGYGPCGPAPSSWRVYGVRGPRTAQALGLPPDASVGDGAILLRSLHWPKPAPIYPVSFLPHFTNAVLGRWPAACKLAGIHYIDPTQPVETVLHQIRSSRRVITLAMHGAIVADAFRIPWTAVRPFNSEHVPKWQDWADALDLTFQFTDLPPSTPDEWFEGHKPHLRHRLLHRQRKHKPLPLVPEGKVAPPYFYPFVPSPLRELLSPLTICRAAHALTQCLAQPTFLSSDTAIERSTTRLQEGLSKFRQDYASGVFTELKTMP